MNSINKNGGLTGNLLWGAFAAAKALYGMVTWRRDSKRAVAVEEIATEVATDAILKQAETSKALIPLSQRVPLLPDSLLLVPTDLYSDAEDASVPEKVSRSTWGWPLGIGAASAAIPLLAGGAAEPQAGAQTASSGFSAFGYAWNCLSTPLQVGVAAVGIIGVFYTAHKIHQAWKKYWESANSIAPVNNNTNTNTLTNTMHINLQLAPGMKLVKTINKKGEEIIEIQMEERQAQKRAAAAAA